MRKFLFLGIVLLFSSHGFSQIGGITASKFNSFNHTPIPVGKAEFEPSYNLNRFSQRWNQDGKLENIYNSSDSIVIDESLNFRMAYALTERLEFGCNLGVDYSNWSAKYAIATYDKLGLGIMAGANFPLGFAVIDKSNRSADQIGSYAFGLIASYEFSDKSSTDLNVQWQDYFQSNIELPQSDLFLSWEYGYYVKDILLVGGFWFQDSIFEFSDQYKLTFVPGVSFEMKEEYMVVINGSFDLLGKNIEKVNGLSVAFTLTL